VEFEFTGRMTLAAYGDIVKTALRPFGVPDSQVVVAGYRHSDGTTWDMKTDASCGFELATPRITWADWPKVEAVTAALLAAGARSTVQCGVHVHHEVRDYTPANLRDLIKVWALHDDAIHAMLTQSRQDNHFAKTFTRLENLRKGRNGEVVTDLVKATVRSAWVRFATFLRTDQSMQQYIESKGRYTSLNTTLFWRSGRVEVRAHHGSLKAADVAPWIEFTQRLVDRVQQGRMYWTQEREVERLVAVPRRRLESLMVLVTGHPTRRTDSDKQLVTQLRRFVRKRQPSFLGQRGGDWRARRAAGGARVATPVQQMTEAAANIWRGARVATPVQQMTEAAANIGRVVLSL
jgi:hypothetical protein